MCTNLKKIVILFLFIISTVSCKKQTINSSNPVASVPVNLIVYPDNPLNFRLQSIGGWAYFDGGINGIVIYRKSQEEFIALERTSSYLPNNINARVKVMSDNFTLQDTISNSRWRLFDGEVIQGPAQWPLRIYATNFNTANGTLMVSN
jgi:hypothetical protein